MALLVALISIAFNIPPAEAMTMLNQWTADFLQLATSTGLITLLEFWYKTSSYKLTDDLMKSVTIASIVSSIKCSGWNVQKLLKLRFRNPDGAIEYVIGLREGALQKRISDYTKDMEKAPVKSRTQK